MSRPVIALLRADGRLGTAFERTLVASGLTEPQFNVLMELAANDGRLPQCELARGLLRSPANVTALIDRMERDGLVRRTRGERDRRTVLSEITERGWEALERRHSAVFSVERQILSDLVDRGIAEQLARSSIASRRAGPELGRAGESVRTLHTGRHGSDVTPVTEVRGSGIRRGADGP